MLTYGWKKPPEVILTAISLKDNGNYMYQPIKQ
jgi:hypothetical protein